MKYVDLTEPINAAHWRYPNYVRTLEFLKRDSLIKSTFLSLDRGFTHLLAPSSMIPGGKTLDDFDLCNSLIGEAAVLHLENVKDGSLITKEQVEQAYAMCKPAKILLLVTGLGRLHDSYSHDYWEKAPHLSVEAAEFIRSLEPTVVGFDFPEDPGMAMDGEARYSLENNPVHKILLEAGILMEEYLNFAWNVPVNNVQMYALPLRMSVGSYHFGPVRAVVKFEEEN